jgi:phage shock protein E
LIPVTELEGRLGEVASAVGGDKTKRVVVYCRSGGRAGRAKALLEANGFSNVVNAGGYDALK